MTAGRAMTRRDMQQAVGQGAAISGPLAGRDTGVGGGFDMPGAYMTTPQVAEALGVSQRQAERLTRDMRLGCAYIYTNGRGKFRQRYDARKVARLVAERGNLCAICGNPARPHAYTCGNNRCACKAYRARRAAYTAARHGR